MAPILLYFDCVVMADKGVGEMGVPPLHYLAEGHRPGKLADFGFPAEEGLAVIGSISVSAGEGMMANPLFGLGYVSRHLQKVTRALGS
jgi:hypothetical protein